MTDVLVMGDLACERAHENGILIAGKEVVERGRSRRWGHGQIISVGGNGVIKRLKQEI
jgi:hypothetical protein